MKLTKEQRQLVIQFVVKNIAAHPKDIVKVTSERFGISRQAANLYIRKMIEENIIVSTGKGRNISYGLKPIEHVFRLPVTKDMSEDKVWREKILPVLPEMKAKVRDICNYGFTEMLNNVIDHSESNSVTLVVKYDPSKIELIVIDEGIGIFNKIQRDFKLEDAKHAILELAKGKLTSDPERHSGEGIFFTSRMFDSFSILSENLAFLGHENDDWLFEDEKRRKGTAVFMVIDKNSSTSIKDVFDRYASGKDDFGFTKTIVPVKLLQYEGEALISRSQAKRLIARFDKFKEVILDFKGIAIVGQPFADEVFRVFVNEHPHVHITPMNTNEDVQKMIKHVLSNK